MVDLKDDPGAPSPRSKMILISCIFGENLAKSYVGAPSYGEYWIRPCKRYDVMASVSIDRRVDWAQSYRTSFTSSHKHTTFRQKDSSQDNLMLQCRAQNTVSYHDNISCTQQTVLLHIFLSRILQYWLMIILMWYHVVDRKLSINQIVLDYSI